MPVAPTAGTSIWAYDAGLRFTSLALTAVLVQIFDRHQMWIALVISFGFAHYLLSFYYARHRIGALVSDAGSALPLFGLGFFGILIYYLDFPLEIYFGIHHACNEGYLRRYQRGARPALESELAAARTLLHLLAYLCILRHEPYVNELPGAILWLALGLSCWLYIHLLYRTSDGKGLPALARESAVEIVFLSLVLLSFVIQISFLQLVLYHFVLWTLAPLPAIRQQGTFPLIEYLLLTGAMLLLFLTLTLTQLFGNVLTLAFWLAQFYIWSYIHITTSFALSAAHPDWLVKLFAPAAPARE